MKKRGAAQATCVVEAGVSLPRKTSGKVILVISGQSRMMYQSLKPEPEGAILSKRSVPQGTDSTPHDADASMTNWLETNIQGTGRGKGTSLIADCLAGPAWSAECEAQPQPRGGRQHPARCT